jgi:hypothetical protein
LKEDPVRTGDALILRDGHSRGVLRVRAHGVFAYSIFR